MVKQDFKFRVFNINSIWKSQNYLGRYAHPARRKAQDSN